MFCASVTNPNHHCINPAPPFQALTGCVVLGLMSAQKSAQALTHTDTKEVRCWRDGGRNSCTLEGVGLVRCGLEVKVRQLCFARVSFGRADFPRTTRLGISCLSAMKV